MVKKICISGNCVTMAIPYFLKTCSNFNERYEIIPLKPVYTISAQQDIDEFKNNVSLCDVFLTQPIVGDKYKNMGIDTESIKNILKPDARLLTMPVPYFSGYFPEQFYLHDDAGNLIGECEGLPSPYHNKIIFYEYVHKMSAEQVYDILYDESYKTDAEQKVKASIAELQKREQTINFPISGFIEENFKKQRLFWTVNHPTNVLIFFISQQFMKILSGIDNCEYVIQNIDKELLDSYFTPILPSVQKVLNLEITDKWANSKYTIDFIKQAYDYYDKHPELVESNKKFIEDM